MTTNTHQNISCDGCRAQNFTGQRFKCLCCSNYDLCETCFEAGTISNEHEKKHPMQCILTSHDRNVYFEGGNDGFSSFTCPVCGQCGLCRVSLAEHLEKSHANEISSSELMCPVCLVFSRSENRISDLNNHVRDEHSDQELKAYSMESSSSALVNLLRRIERQNSANSHPEGINRSLSNASSGSGVEDRRLSGMFRLMQRVPISRQESSISQRDETREFDELLRLINDREMRDLLNVNVHERIQSDLARRRHQDEKRQRKISQYIGRPQGTLTRCLNNKASVALLDNCALTDDEDSKKESGKLSKKKGGNSESERAKNLEQGLLPGLCVEADSLDSGMTDAAELILRSVFCQEIFYSSLSSDISSNARDSSSYHDREV